MNKTNFHRKGFAPCRTRFETEGKGNSEFFPVLQRLLVSWATPVLVSL